MAEQGWVPKLTREQMEERRMKAIELFKEEYSQSEIARKLGVNRSSSCRWENQFNHQGIDGLKRKIAPGPETKLNDSQIKALDEILIDGASKYGYDTDLWTLKRIAEVIKKEFKINYHPSSLCRTLKLLGYSCQKPSKRASNRKEEDRQIWIKTVWEEDKKN